MGAPWAPARTLSTSNALGPNPHTLPLCAAPLLQVAQLLDDFSMVSFTPLDVTDEESIEACLQQVDSAIQVRCAGRPAAGNTISAWGVTLLLFAPCPPLQYGEDQDVRTRELGDFPDDDDGPDY